MAIKILSTRRVNNFWQLVRKWFDKKFDDLFGRISPFLYAECSERDIDMMFGYDDGGENIYIPKEIEVTGDYLSLQAFLEALGFKATGGNDGESLIIGETDGVGEVEDEQGCWLPLHDITEMQSLTLN